MQMNTFSVLLIILIDLAELTRLDIFVVYVFSSPYQYKSHFLAYDWLVAFFSQMLYL